MKRIEFDSPPVAARLARRKKIARLFPFHERREFAAMTASSQEEANQLACAFRSDAAKVHVTGQPRNDRLAIMDRPRLGSSTLHLLYAPTFRDTDPSASIRQILENAAAIQATLEELDAWLHVRLHPNSPRPEEGCVGGRVRFESKLASSEDPVEALEAADVLITDYSSIFVDYLLTRRPIIFFPYDLDRYLTSERDFYFDYLDPVITPGPRCTTWTEVIRLVRDVAAGADPYRDQRLAALARWHHFVDGDNSLRVMDLASNLVQRRERR